MPAEDLTAERWLPVPGFGKYEVSDLGRMRRIVSSPGRQYRMLRPSPGTRGYIRVGLSRPDGRECSKPVHRLVLEAFMPTDDPDLQANHLNGNKADNRLENLAWVTQSQNQRHAMANGLSASVVGSACFGAKLVEAQAEEIMRLYATGEYSQNNLAVMFGVARGTIRDVVERRTWKHVAPASPAADAAKP